MGPTVAFGPRRWTGSRCALLFFLLSLSPPVSAEEGSGEPLPQDGDASRAAPAEAPEADKNEDGKNEDGKNEAGKNAASQRDGSADDLDKTIAALEARVAELEAERDAQRLPSPADPESAPEPGATSGSQQAKAALSDAKSEVRHRSTFRDDHSAAPRPNNAPVDKELKGFFPLGDTGTWLKLGGYAKVDAIVDSTALGNPNKFATSSIFTSSQSEYGEGGTFNLHAKQSRLSFEARTPTPFGSLRVVYENDFFGDGLGPGMVYNLRHLYGQLANLTIGQTWTLYLDADAIPDTLDFAGPGVQAIHRQPQVRYTLPFLDNHAHAALALEQPNGDISGVPVDGVARDVVPDLTAALRIEGEKVGHVHLGGVARLLGYEDGAGDRFGALAFSVNLSSVINTFGKDHLVLNGTVGDGTGRYAQDLGSASAAVVDANGDLQTLLTFGGFLGYRHFWAEDLRSQVTYGYLRLEDRSELPVDAYRSTHYAQANLVWSPDPRFNIGAEYLFGHKRTRDGATGQDHRVQLSAKFGLF